MLGAASSISPNYLPCTPVYTPSLARPISPWQLPVPMAALPPPPPPSTPVGGLGGLPPNHPYLQDYAMLVLNNITRLQQQQEAEQVLHQNRWTGGGQPTEPSPSQPPGGMSGHSTSGMGSSLQSSPFRPSPRPFPPRNSSPVNPSGNLTNNLHKMDLTTASSGIGVDKGNSSVSPNSDFSAFLSELSVEDRRAPGCEKKVVQIATAADYGQKKLLAAKATRNKPMGEPRTPNDVWSGLGFSSSMPEDVIREKLAQEHNQARQAREKEVISNSHWTRQSNDASLLPGSNDVAQEDGLPNLLAKQGLSKYTDVFLRHEIDLPTFVALTDEDLKEVGISTFGARKKLLLLGKDQKHLLNQK